MPFLILYLEVDIEENSSIALSFSPSSKYLANFVSQKLKQPFSCIVLQNLNRKHSATSSY